nr:hypothetical protein [Mycoplasmopsis bovis]
MSLNDDDEKEYHKPLFAVCNSIVKGYMQKNDSVHLKLEFDRLNDIICWVQKIHEIDLIKSQKNLTYSWGIVDSISSKLSSILLELRRKYIYKNKSNLTHTYNSY